MISVTPAAMGKLDAQIEASKQAKEEVAFRIFFAGAG